MKLLTLEDLVLKIGASKASIWRWHKAGLFPKPIKIGVNRTAWVESEVDEWIQKKMDARR